MEAAVKDVRDEDGVGVGLVFGESGRGDKVVHDERLWGGPEVGGLCLVV